MINDRQRGAVLAIVLASVAITAAVTYLVVGGGGGGASNRIDPSYADARAHVAIPTELDLPGSGWFTSEVDRFRDSNNSSRKVSSCDAWNAATDGLEAKLKDKLAGRAERQFQQIAPGATGAALTVKYQVFVYHDDRDVDSVLETVQALGPDAFVRCAGELLATPAVTVSSIITEPTASSPEGAWAAAAALTPSTGNVSFQTEEYIWQYGNAIAQVDIFAYKPALTPEFADSILKLAVEGLQRASQENPPRLAPVVLATPRLATPVAAAVAGTGAGVYTGSVDVGLTDNVPQGSPYVIQNIYNPNVRQIIAVISIENVAVGTRVEGQWFQMHAFDAGSTLDLDVPATGTLITRAGFEVSQDAINATTGKGGGRLTLSPTRPLPEDSYKLLVFVDGKLARDYPFVISRVVPVR